MENNTPQLKPDVLGQLLLMQSIVGSLPGQETIFDFVCKGLLDVPGIQSAKCCNDKNLAQDDQTICFPIQEGNRNNKQLILTLSDRDAFLPYQDYVNNFCFMLSIILDERKQREINETYNKELEQRVEERTRSLQKEIEERKKTEEALYASEQLFRATFEYAAIGKCLTDTDGTIRRVNSAFADIMGRQKSELIGCKINDFTHPDDIELSFSNIEALTSGKSKTVSFEKRYLHSSGRTIWCSVGSTLMRRRDGSPHYCITHVDDITAQKKAEAEKEKLEDQLRQAHKMEAIGTLAGGIAHDFNNILAVILGYADLADDDTPEFSPAKQSIEQVQQAALRAKDIVQQILTFSRKQSQKLVPLDLASTISSTLKFIRASIPTTIDIEANIDQKCGVILGDESQINQILINFCTNAAQAMDDIGGTLSIDLQSINLSEDDAKPEQKLLPGSYIVLSVSDTGVGIEEKHLERIFDPYYTTKDIGKGSGMGLAVVHGLVKSHNGFLQVGSTVSQGSTFKVFFPKADAITEKINMKKQIQHYSGSEHLLIVDDEQSIINIMERSIKSMGYSIDATTSSKKALQLFRNDPSRYDLIITDQTMPELTGEALCNKILQTRPDIPIIMCTGYSTKIDKEAARELGVTRFLMKPVSKVELARAIRESIDTNSAASPHNNPL